MNPLKYWRLNWTIQQVFTFRNYRNHRLILHSSWKYWFALIVKFFPGVYTKAISLKLRDGGTFVVKDFMTLYIYNEIFVERSYDYPSLKISNALIIDIGANTGLFTLRMKELYPDSSIYCYEPFKNNFEQLSQNIQLSALKDIEIIQKGVGGISRTEKLFLNKSNLGGHSLYEQEARSNEYVSIDIVGIQDMMNALASDRIHLMKMDCEGAEYEIIKAITPELASKIEIILFESTESVYEISELTDHLTKLGFELEFIEKSCNYVARNRAFMNQV